MTYILRLNRLVVQRCFAGIAMAGLAVLIGCSGQQSLPEHETNLRAISTLYGIYQSQNQGRAPSSQQEFEQFVNGLSADELKTYGVDNVEKMFVSPRDKEPYIIRFGVSAGPPGAPPVGAGGEAPQTTEPVIAHEATGVDGQRYVVYATGVVELIDEAKFQEITSP